MANVIEPLTDEEAALWCILQDPSGLDQAEFFWYNQDEPDGCWRAWSFQWSWYRSKDPLQIDQCARSVGKSLSIKMRAFAFPFLYPGQEMVITAPELVHLHPITGLVENQFQASRVGQEMLPKGRNRGITHRPFQMDFLNGARIMGRIPQRDGKGVKGCAIKDTPVLTDHGYVMVQDLKPGDMVLTHKGRYMPVEWIETDINDCYEVRGAGSYPLTVSCDHEFLGSENQAGPKQKRDFLPLRFHDVEFLLEEQVYWATPTQFPELSVPTLVDDRLDQRKDEFWWLVGRYLADGVLSPGRHGTLAKVYWICPDHKADALLAAGTALGEKLGRTQRAHSSADEFRLCSTSFARWLQEHFGRLANGKKIPSWALGMDERHRNFLLEGYLAGDGWFNAKKKRWEVGSASKELAMGIQLLAQTLGYTVNATSVKPKPNVMCANPQISWRVQIGHGHSAELDGHLVGKVKSVKPVGKQTIYNPIVAEDHSYVTGTVVSHNLHPIWLELDEAQDYPEPGWIELIETLKRGHAGAVWRAHGVTRGLRDHFYKFTQPESGWTVHRFTAMHRPNWTDQERQEKIEQYGSKDHPDYRRNVLGLHGDATNPLFVLHRLMACVDSDESSDYNQDEYFQVRVNDEMIRDSGSDILQFMDFPTIHNGPPYIAYWAGMDVGYTNHPSEILVFGEIRGKPKSKLKLLTRMHLERINHKDQVAAMIWTIDNYRPKAFALDKTGLGLPLFQDLQNKAEENPRLTKIVDTIKGYNFSSKILVDFDDTIEVDDMMGDPIKEAGIERNVLEYSTDKLREFVDHERLILPWDRGLLGEFQGQTYTVVRSAMDQYGRKRYSQGQFHALDAARMAVLGYAQNSIEEFVKNHKEEPVFDVIMGF